MLSPYFNNYVIILIFIGLGILLPIIALTLGRILRPHNPIPAKAATYESGNETIGDSWIRFKVKYYIFAILFVIFDVEAIYLFPWAVAYDQLGLYAVIEAFLFIFLLFIGLIYAWRKGALEWK